VTVSRCEVEDFLYGEAALLDGWQLDQWLELFTDDCCYRVPPTDRPDAVPGVDAFLIDDDRRSLQQRVESLQKRSAHAEWPHSRTRRIVSNVRLGAQDGESALVHANFIVARVRYGEVALYVGRYEHRLVVNRGALRFAERTAILDLESLRPEGKISIIL
jgi:p-cumate 2,3-dioxygenase beta subunit